MPGQFSEQWREYRHRHWAASISFIGGFPCVAAIALAVEWITGRKSMTLLAALLFAWALIFCWLAFRVARFPCLRCGISFLGNKEMWTNCCGNCGLKLYENS
jgi:uncharacterized MAPEG superfamily protein